MPAGDGDDPILYIEELTRLPFRRRLPPLPGTAMVYRMADGRIRVPEGGYTAGELLLLGPALAYEVDLARHAFRFEAAVGERSAAVVTGSGYWQVTDPGKVVSHRVGDAGALCREFVLARLRRLAAERADDREQAGWHAAVGRLPDRSDLPEGITITELTAELEPGAATVPEPGAGEGRHGREEPRADETGDMGPVGAA